MTPGIYPAIPMAEYVADRLCDVPSLSSGCAHTLIAQSPYHAWYRHPRLGGHAGDQSNVADRGSVAHDMLLGGEKKICVIEPSDHPSKNGEIPKGWTNTAIRAVRELARSNGLTPILAAEMAGVRAMTDAALAFISASKTPQLLDDGVSEVTVIGQEGDTLLRTRPDYLNLKRGFSLSYKTTMTKAHIDTFQRLGESMGYFFSLMFYDRVLRANGEEARHIILLQEQMPPWACAMYELSPAKAAIERQQVSRAIALWERCMADGQWPGYPGSIQRLEPKPWEMAQEEARLVEEEMQAMETA